MTALAWLIPVALFLGGMGLAAFLWALRTDQFEDLEGAGWRALDDTPLEASRRKSADPLAATAAASRRVE